MFCWVLFLLKGKNKKINLILKNKMIYFWPEMICGTLSVVYMKRPDPKILCILVFLFAVCRNTKGFLRKRIFIDEIVNINNKEFI